MAIKSAGKLLSLQSVSAMKHLLLPFFLLLLALQARAIVADKPQDSVGIALKNGNYFIIHEVVNRQTLFALSKVYKVSIQEILEANTGMLPAVQTGQLLYIPLKNFTPKPGTVFSSISSDGKLTGANDDAGEDETEPLQTPELKTETPTPPKQKEPEPEPDTEEAPAETPEKFNWKNYAGTEDLYHEVKNGETLYRIATFYGLSVQEIMELNNLESSLIAKGQQLLIRKAKKKPETPKTAPKEEKPKETPKTEPKNTPAENPVENTGGEVIESGMALVIDKNFPEAEKNIALHISAPVGTILMVNNPQNGRTVYLRVVGKLETQDKTLLLMISPTAANELGVPLTGKVKLTLSYAQ